MTGMVRIIGVNISQEHICINGGDTEAGIEELNMSIGDSVSQPFEPSGSTPILPDWCLDEEDMSREEINKYIHVKIMGKCWHKEGECFGYPDGKCSLCGVTIYTAPNPDYCSDASARSLLNAVMATLDSDVAISGAVSGTSLPTFRCNAEQLARACVEVHKGEGQWRMRRLRKHERSI